MKFFPSFQRYMLENVKVNFFQGVYFLNSTYVQNRNINVLKTFLDTRCDKISKKFLRCLMYQFWT